MCVQVKIERKPLLGPEEIIPLAQMDSMVRSLPLTWNEINLDDHSFFVPAFDDWRKIIEYLLPKLPMYYTDKFDCDNFADWFKVHAAEDFGKNCAAKVRGWATINNKVERHAWNVLPDGQYFYQLETQTGELMDIDDPRYVPDQLEMG
jgi:hypothetical protein